MQTSPDFSGLWIPLVTPFHHGQVDTHALTQLVKHYASTGIAGLVLCGSTGEAAALNKAEQLALLDAALSAAQGLPVVMGVSGYHLPDTKAWIETLASRPLAGLLLPAPHYIRPSQAGLVQWFHTLADASALPMVVYDIPYRTGATLSLATLRELAAHPHIVALKDCGGDASKTQALIHDRALQVLAGEDAQIFSTLALGGVGVIAASAHLCTEQFVRVIAALRRGDLPTARAQWQALPAVIELLFSEPNPAVIKAALALHGLLHNELRAPMQHASPAALARVQEAQLSLR